MKRKGNLSGPNVRRLILRRIENGRFRSGDRLIPAVIARELGGSTIPVREALCQLVGRDILTERRNRGFIVTPITSGMLRSFYIAHGELMDRVFREWPYGAVLSGRIRNRWSLFAASTDRTGDEATRGMAHYLNGRLALVRRFEDDCIDGNEDTADLAMALHTGDVDEARKSSARFHESCILSCTRIWQMMSDR
ncbi:GntR family transcriptional regulator [Sphingomonas adhaesiva]|uniref:GntR family transcriptional regulator n=1 Tax=Sphingomonas adhaesiva TaxID=28212 RepID=UPI002FFA39BF